MDSSSQHINLPLDGLIERLHLAGFELSPRQRIQMWQVLEHFGTGHLKDISSLQYRLAPIISTNAAEQQQFYQVFEKYLSDVKDYQPEAPEEPLQWWEKIPAWIWGVILLAGLLSLLAGLFFWLQYKETPILQAQHPRIVQVGSPFTIENFSTGYDTATTEFYWELCDAKTQEVEQNHQHPEKWEVVLTEQGSSPDKTVRLIARVGAEQDTFQSPLQVHCADPPRFRAILITKPADSIGLIRCALPPLNPEEGLSYQWQFGDGATATGSEVAHTYEEAGAYEVVVRIERSGQNGYCFQTLNTRVSIGQKEYAFLAYKSLIADEPAATLHVGPVIWLLIALIALAALFFWFRWLRQKPDVGEEDKKKAALHSRFSYEDKGPYQIPFQSKDELLRPDARMFQLAQILRLRQEGLRTELDIPATIQNTIERGGFPVVQMKRTTLPPNYLFLMDEQAPHSHTAQLYQHLLHFLRGQDVHIAAFWYKKVPDYFWNSQHPKGLNLEQLQRLYPHYRLLVMGDAHEMLDKQARDKHQVSPRMAAIYKRWKSRLLLSPLSIADWTYKEAAIYELMTVFPGDTNGIDGAMAFLELDQEEEDLRARAGFNQWKAAFQQPPIPPETNYRNWKRVAAYDQYFEQHPELYRWFRALMVYPSPSWPLTLAIGQAIGAPIHFDHLLMLSRIPYLQGKPISHQLRMQLLAGLEEDTLQSARAAVAEELKLAAPAVANSHANRKLQTQLAMQQFLIDPDKGNNRAAILHLIESNTLNKRELSELGEGLKRQKGEQTSLSNFLAERNEQDTSGLARKAINSDFFRAATLSLLLLIGCVLIGALDGSKQLHQQINNWFGEPSAQSLLWSTDIEADSALIFHNQAVASWDSIRTRAAIPRISDLEKIGDQLQKAIDFRGGSYFLAEANHAKNEYHKGILHYHRYLQDRDSAGLNLTSAISYFEQARTSNATQADALHALGLLAYYEDNIQEATTYYNGLIAQYFFDTLQLQPNLRSLLFQMEGDAVRSNCLPPPAIEMLNGDTLCLGDTLRLTIRRPKKALDYYVIRWGDGQVDTLQVVEGTIDWGNGEVDTLRNSTNSISHVYNLISGSLPVSVLGFGACENEGQVFNISTEVVEVFSTPKVEGGIIATAITGCAPLTVDFKLGEPFLPSFEYKWDFNNGDQSTSNNPSTTFKKPGTYRVSLEVRTNCGVSMLDQTIVVFSKEDCQRTLRASGEILDAETGRPVASASILAGNANTITNAQLYDGTAEFRTSTDDRGRYELQDIPSVVKQLQILVRKQGYKDYTTRYALGKVPLTVRLERSEDRIQKEDTESQEPSKNPPGSNSEKEPSKNPPIDPPDEVKSEDGASSKLEVGQRAPDITLPNPEGKKLSLSDLEGKIVLLHFWQSWASSNRRENQQVVKIYNKYKDRGFTVFSVSLEEDLGRNRWQETIQKDSMTWPYHVSNLEGFRGQGNADIINNYDLRGTTSYFLIDRNGNLATRNITIYQIENELKKILY